MIELLQKIEKFLSNLTAKEPPTKEIQMNDEVQVTTVDAVVAEAEKVVAVAEPVVDAIATVIPQVAAVDPFLRALGLVLTELGHDTDGIIGAASALAKLFK